MGLQVGFFQLADDIVTINPMVDIFDYELRENRTDAISFFVDPAKKSAWPGQIHC